MNAPAEGHNAFSAMQHTCVECRGLFTPKRDWSRFCRPKCRNDFHGRERRRKAIEARAIPMYQALAAIAAGADDPQAAASAAIGGLKAP